MRLIRDVRELDALEDGWKALAGRSAGPMQRHDWIRACMATFGRRRALHLLVVGQPPDLAAVAPLARRLDGLGRLETVELDEPTDILGTDDSALEQWAEVVLRSGRPLLLKRVPADSRALAAIRTVYQGRGVVLCRRQLGSPFIPLDPSWTRPEQHLGPGRRSDLRRARRIAERMGPISMAVMSPAPDEVGGLLREAFEVEAAGWKGRRRSALSHDPLRRAFYCTYAASAALQGRLRLCFLRIGGRPVAMQLAVECADRFWLLKIGYDEAFARCSPGTLLMLDTVRYAAERGLSSYELLGCAEPWTRIWTHRERPCVTLRAYPATRLGLAGLVTDLAAMVGRRVGRVVGRRS